MNKGDGFNFKIQSSSPVSMEFLNRKIADFTDATHFIRQLPYKRNADKTNLLSVFSDGYGTCSTKHALIKRLAIENQADEVMLKLGIFRMNKMNTPEVASTLKKHGLDYIPEAHNYLRIGNKIIDCTKPTLKNNWFVDDLMVETDLAPEQITGFKVNYHQAFLQHWLDKNPQMRFTLDQIFAIREQCIMDLMDPVVEVKTL